MDVSCVIPCVDEHEYIEKSVNSMLNQTVEPLEVVVVNSGGDQRTIDATPDHDLVKVVVEDEVVCSSRARNIGVANSEGDLICFLDADDISKQDRIEKQIQYFPEYDVTAQWLHTVERIDENGEVKREYNPIEPDGLGCIENRSVAYSSSIMCKKEVAFWDECYRTAEDFKFMIDRLKERSNINLSNNNVMSYRDRGDSSTNTSRRISARTQIRSRLSE